MRKIIIDELYKEICRITEACLEEYPNISFEIETSMDLEIICDIFYIELTLLNTEIKTRQRIPAENLLKLYATGDYAIFYIVKQMANDLITYSEKKKE